MARGKKSDSPKVTILPEEKSCIYQFNAAKRVPCEASIFGRTDEIVSTITNLLDLEGQAKEAAEAVLDRIDTMKKAILARAFRGELGTNDPEEEWAGELLKTVL